MRLVELLQKYARKDQTDEDVREGVLQERYQNNKSDLKTKKGENDEGKCTEKGKHRSGGVFRPRNS